MSKIIDVSGENQKKNQTSKVLKIDLSIWFRLTFKYWLIFNRRINFLHFNGMEECKDCIIPRRFIDLMLQR